MLLTEKEAADRLRCSREKIKRLRLSGQLTFISGRPVLIDEVDLDIYVEKKKCRHQSSERPTTATTTPSGQKESEAAARAWALKTMLTRNRGSRNGS
jgi:excisionase family DNA binding protein